MWSACLFVVHSKACSWFKGGRLSDMEREQYQNQIKDLLQVVETLLKSNNAMGEKLEKTTAAYEDLKAKYEKLEGELAMRKCGQHGKRIEKRKDYGNE